MPDAARFDALLATKQALLAADGDLNRIFDVVVDRSLGVIPDADGAIVEMRDADRLVYRAASGPAHRWIGRKVEMAASLAGRSMMVNRARICADVEEENALDPTPYRDIGMRALVIVPLVQLGRTVGALKFYSREPHAFVARDLMVAELIASQLISSLIAIGEDTATRARQESNARFETITETLPQLIWTMTPLGRPTYGNRRLLQFLGLDRIEDFGGNMLSIIDPAFHAEARAHWRAGAVRQEAISVECQVRDGSGRRRWMLTHVAPVITPGKDGIADEWIGAATDIDERKAMELALQDAVHGRELLLHEVNHRVKNSLQIVTGLLTLHASRLPPGEARVRLMDARSQIGTIAQIHQSIYQTSQHDQVEFVAFLRMLASSLVGRGKSGRAELVFDAPDELLLPIERGVPVALVAGEIITNAVKHGTNRDDARISISITNDPGGCVVDIADNGPGLSEDFAPELSSGLGMEIIFGLAKQVGGRVEIDNSGEGVRFRLVLPATA